MVEGRRFEPGVCPQCGHVQEADYSELLSRCPSCDLPLCLVAGRYRMLSLLNTGSFAWIYRAVDLTSSPGTKSLCAIKVFKPGVVDEVTEKLRFQREVRLTSLLGQQCKHIVRLHEDFGFADELGHFYAMELLHGMSMDEILYDDEELEASLTFHILGQLCEALTVVHQHGVTHRDLKPENIFLIERDGDPNFVKLIDFGIARYKDTQHRFLTQEILGTPVFMSPEQCEGGKIDHRSDVYAVGMLMYRCLTGTVPFELDEEELASPRKRALAIMHAHISRPPLPPSAMRSDLSFPAPFEQALMQALAKDPDQRPQTIAAFWDAVAPWEEQME